MGQEERRQVSARMKSYWKKRRQQTRVPEMPTGHPPEDAA